MNSPNLPVVSEGSRLTPGELHSVVFARAALGRRGYDEEQVRNFLQYVERELVKIFTDKAALADEVNRLRSQASSGSRGVMAPEDAHFQAVRILSQAQQTADLYVADAERYTRELAHEARLHREAILSDAKGRAEQMLEDAHRKAAAVAEAAVRTAPPQAAPAPAPRTSRTRIASPWSARSPTCAPTATSTGPTCAPIWRRCSATSTSGSPPNGHPSLEVMPDLPSRRGRRDVRGSRAVARPAGLAA
ncbi:DivIVA domain-containing protein [Actinomadura luteofluorescens]|uniref:DivIVA domain-containing protein n=1 Tax=Actinomadura luteofluorescens TaxID=46163 RepID=UPI0036446029